METTTERQRIIELTNRQPCECSCNLCADMCRRSPCLGTPQDILNIIEAGHTDKVTPYVWAAGMLAGIPPIYMIQLPKNESGCIMFKDGKCTLHDTELKPLEGILAIHSSDPNPSNAHPSIAVAKTWLDSKNTDIVIKIVNAIKAHYSK